MDLPRTPGPPSSGRLALDPSPANSRRFLHPQPLSPRAGGSERGVLASPTLSATSLAGQPRPGAPAWAADWAQLGAARSRTARALAAATGQQRRGSQPWARRPPSAAPRSAWVGGSRSSRSGRRGGAHGFPLQMPVSSSHFPPPALRRRRSRGSATAASAVPGLAGGPASPRVLRAKQEGFPS